MSASDPIVIVGAARTPMGGFLGDLKDAPAHALGARAISAAVERAGVAADSVDEILMGCVLPAGQGQAPARQAAIGAGLPVAAGATTINKMCGSGMKAAMLAHDLLRAGSADVVVAGGMESMSNAPYLLDRARSGYRMGHGRTLDHMFLDGLEDAYDKGRLMGTFAEDCAEAYQFTREEQDAYALSSLERANRAIKNGDFAWEIAPVSVKARQGRDARRDRRATAQGEARQDPDAQARLPRRRHGDGGQFELDLRRRRRARPDARKRGREARLRPLARVLAHAPHAAAPKDFPTAPIGAIRKLLEKTGWSKESVDLFEINEAFAVVAMAAMRDLRLPHEKVNVNGGACALGHPIGASGARILVTLIAALRARGRQARRGVALHRRRRSDRYGDRDGVKLRSPRGKGGGREGRSRFAGFEKQTDPPL